ncbi:MAG: hypothetical protein MJ070_09370 [Lachnospiraceae bacterium]|nr:hypothetical protein [Lachnospiraceae bacterium]
MELELQNEIIGLLPSEELRDAVRERKTAFTDPELLKIVWDYAQDYETRLGMLGRLYDAFTGDIREYTGLLIARQKFCLDELMKPEEDAVFELHIKDTPDSYDERYLCASYEAARKMIPLFFREYECEPTKETVYRIVKRKIYRGKDDEPFSEDYLGHAVLLPSGKLYSVDVLKDEDALCRGNRVCMDCSLVCIHNIDAAFPRIIANGDVVKFRCALGQPERIGVVLFSGEAETECEYYVIPLDCTDVRYHHFDTDFWDHEHVPAPLIMKITPNELNDKMREDYFAFMEYMNNNNE